MVGGNSGSWGGLVLRRRSWGESKFCCEIVNIVVIST